MTRSKLHTQSLGALLVTLFLWGGTPPEAPVADAAMRGDLDRVEALIRQGADLNAAHGDGMTALHWAAEEGRLDIALRLLEAGASVSPTTRLGDYTPLHIAARGGYAEIVSALLTAGADPATRTSTGGSTPLHFAASTSSSGAVEALIAFGADVNVREDHWGQTPLMFAASAGRLETVDLLLAAGADVHAMTGILDMRTRAAEDRAAGQVRDRVLREIQGDRVAGGGEGWLPSPTEVQAALREARNLSEDEVGASMRTLRSAFTPPQVQADNPTDDAAQAEALAQQAALQIEDDEEDEYDNSYPALVGAQGGLTPLLHAVREGEAEVALRLIEAGADINQPSGGDRTSPLLMAAMNGHFDLMFDLIERGADPNLGSHAGTTPLFAVINTQWAPKARYPQQRAYLQQEATHYDVMERLLAAGADPNVRLTKHLWFMEYTFSHLGVDMRGATPFWRAAHALDVAAMKMLVEAGADPSVPTQKPPERRRRGGDGPDPSGLPPVEVGGPGVYPIHAATGHGYGTGYAGNSHRHVPDAWMQTVRYLVDELGADVNQRDHDGYTPLHNAAARGDVEMLQFLVEHGADPLAVSRRGQTTVDMANGPVQRVQPFPRAIAYLEGLGAKNNHNCLGC